MKVFLSYCTSGSTTASLLKEMVIRILSECDDQDPHVFAYEWSNTSSDLWQEALRTELISCDCIVVLWTTGSINSYAQHIEIGATWILDKDIHTVRYGTTSDSLPFLVLGGRHAISWSDFYREFTKYVQQRLPSADHD